MVDLVSCDNMPPVERNVQTRAVCMLVLEIHHSVGTWRAVADLLVGYGNGHPGYSPSYWYQIAYRRLKPSRTAENTVRRMFRYATRLTVPEVNRMFKKDILWYLSHRTEATFPPCIELWVP